VNQASFLEAIHGARRVRGELLASIHASDITRCGVVGEWSTKDTISHISWFEREVADLLETKEPIWSELWNVPPDDLHDAFYKQHREQSLEEALSDSTEGFSRLVSAIKTMEYIDLPDPKRYKSIPPIFEHG